MAIATMSRETTSKAQGVLNGASGVLQQGLRRVAGLRPRTPARTTIDLRPFLDGYFDSMSRLTARLAEHNASFAKEVAGSVVSVQRAVLEQAKSVTVEVRDELRSLSELARNQVGQVEQVAREQAEAAEREAQRQRREARREAREAAAALFEGMTKPELQDELAKRDLPKSGNVDELRAVLIEAELQASLS